MMSFYLTCLAGSMLLALGQMTPPALAPQDTTSHSVAAEPAHATSESPERHRLSSWPHDLVDALRKGLAWPKARGGLLLRRAGDSATYLVTSARVLRIPKAIVPPRASPRGHGSPATHRPGVTALLAPQFFRAYRSTLGSRRTLAEPVGHRVTGPRPIGHQTPLAPAVGSSFSAGLSRH